MRGKVSCLEEALEALRITPAYAGKSDYGGLHFFAVEDHPRLCGEKFFVRHGTNYRMGSPPPMRGKAQRPYKPHGARGITPAYAGKSGSFADKQQLSEDHPRLCGEKSLHHHCLLSPIGSPPPMRGKGCEKHPPCCFSRITPAYAGKR